MSGYGAIPRKRIEVLGNVPVYGTVIFFDDLEDTPLKWTEAGTGGDTVFERNTSTTFNKGASLHMKTRTTGASVGDNIQAYRYAFIGTAKKISFNCLFYYVSDTLIDTLQFILQWADGSTRHQALVQYLPPEAKWQYYSSGGTWTDITGGNKKIYYDAWHRLKLITNFATDKYVSLTVDENLFDLSALDLYTSSYTLGRFLAATLKLTTETASPAECYYDDILIMEEE